MVIEEVEVSLLVAAYVKEILSQSSALAPQSWKAGLQPQLFSLLPVEDTDVACLGLYPPTIYRYCFRLTSSPSREAAPLIALPHLIEQRFRHCQIMGS